MSDAPPPPLPPPPPMDLTPAPFAGNILQPPPGYGLVPGSKELRPLVEDTGGMHFLRYILISFAMGLAMYVVVGLIWMAIALSQTGRRKRDLLMLLIPIWGSVVAVQTQWRYTSKNIYWSSPADRDQKSLFQAT